MVGLGGGHSRVAPPPRFTGRVGHEPDCQPGLAHSIQRLCRARTEFVTDVNNARQIEQYATNHATPRASMAWSSLPSIL